MKNIEKWLEESGIEYDHQKYGNPYYFKDGFQVDGLLVAFYFDGIGNAWNKMHELERFMKRKKAYSCICSRFGAGYTYHIMTVFDAKRLEEHEKRIQEAAEKFWQDEHARRMLAREAV